MTGIVEIQVGTIKVKLIDDCRIAKHVLSGKQFEPESLAMWAGMCKPGKVALDIGAYSGLFSIAAARLGCIARAFEPMPNLQRRIAENAGINSVSIAISNCAISDKDGMAELGYNARVHLTSGASLSRKSEPRLPVATYALDTFAYRDVCAIKIDVERHEEAVIRGALKTIERERPSLLIECITHDPAGGAISDSRKAIAAMLPSYEMSDPVDKRNVVMVPR